MQKFSTSACLISITISKLFETFLSDLDRSVFLRKWSLPSSPQLAKSFVAKQNDRIVGYGTIRRLPGYWAVSPLYADSSQIGDPLLRFALRSFPDTDNFFISTLASNGAILAAVSELNWAKVEVEFRVMNHGAYERVGRKLDWDKVFAIHEFYPL